MLVHRGSVVPSFYGIEASGRPAGLIGGSRPVDDVGHSITVYRR
ncbi:hypothetical protein [Streptomyces massasporeus]